MSYFRLIRVGLQTRSGVGRGTASMAAQPGRDRSGTGQSSGGHWGFEVHGDTVVLVNGVVGQRTGGLLVVETSDLAVVGDGRGFPQRKAVFVIRRSQLGGTELALKLRLDLKVTKIRNSIEHLNTKTGCNKKELETGLCLPRFLTAPKLNEHSTHLISDLVSGKMGNKQSKEQGRKKEEEEERSDDSPTVNKFM